MIMSGGCNMENIICAQERMVQLNYKAACALT